MSRPDSSPARDRAPGRAHLVASAFGRALVPLALIVLATTWPFSVFQDHSHWADVEWIPFTKYARPFDLLANVALFVPLGVALAWRGTSSRDARRAVLVGLACSLAVEFAQVYTHNRAATVSDLLTNTLGAWLGARWTVRRGSALAAQDGDELGAA